jgi:nicotinate-nucleotide pyrophosphorylase
MHKAADRTDLSEQHGDSFGSIVSDLIVLVRHVRASIDLMEAAIARETADEAQEAAPEMADVVVLDDVTPQYIKASHALNACHASLGETLQFLLEARRSGEGSVAFTAH